MMNQITNNEIEPKDENENQFIHTPTGKKVLFAGAFIILFITFHFLFPIFTRFDWAILPESIYLFNLIPINGNYFFGLMLAILVSYLFAYRNQFLRKIGKALGLLVVSFGVLFITFHFLLPGLPTTALDRFPETVYIFGIAIRSTHFFALLLSLAIAILLIFYPNKFKTLIKFMFSFWGFKVALTFVDIFIFRNLLRASDADYFSMWTIPLLFAFLTNFLPFFFAVAFKTHQEGFEDKQEASRVKKTSYLRQRLSRIGEKEDNRMKTASRTFLWTTSLLLIATAWLITNQRWIQMNQSLHASLAHFEDMGPHTILIDGVSWYIENPPLDELPAFAVMQDFWHLNESGQPVYGRYPQFLIDFTLLMLPILLIFVTALASYFNISHKITNRWYQLLEEITDRKKKKMRIALSEYEEVKQRYEAAKFEYDQAIFNRNSEMRKLQVLIGARADDVLNDMTTFEKNCRETILENSLRTTLSSYDTHLNNLYAWILNDLEVFKSKMATNHEVVTIQQTILDIDLNEIIHAYNATVEPLKQFDTTEKTEALMSRLKTVNKAESIRMGDQEHE